MQKVFAEVSHEIGFEMALELVRRWGGTSLSVPVKIDEAHPITAAIGLESARKLIASQAGKDLQLPTLRSAMRDMRDEEIYRACVVQGKSHSSVCGNYGLSRQAVAAVLRRFEAKGQPEACAS